MRRIRPKLTYSNVMVTILAVIVLGGGSAYAAVAGVLKPDSVGPIQIKDEAVGPVQLQDEAVNASKIKDGSVTLSKLSSSAKNSLKGEKGPKGERGETGAQGSQGAQGPQGAPGSSGGAAQMETEIVTAATASDTSTPKELSVHCPNGPVLGGGFVLHNASGSPSGQAKLRAVRSYPVDANTWLVRATDDSNGTEGEWELTVIAVCRK